MANEFKALVTAISAALDLIDDLKPGPLPFDATGFPDAVAYPGVNACFTLDIQTSDTAAERQASLMRVEHVITVSVLSRIKMANGWLASLGDALDLEQDIIAKLLTVATTPGYDVRYLGTARSLTTNREYILHEMQWSYESTIGTGRS